MILCEAKSQIKTMPNITLIIRQLTHENRYQKFRNTNSSFE